MRTIASRHNPVVAGYRELAARPDAHGARLLLDGAHLVREAAAAGWRFESACVAASRLDDGSEAGSLAAALDQQGIDVIVVSDPVFAAVSPVRTPSGITAIAMRSQPDDRARTMYEPAGALLLVAVDVQDPGNVGALIRVAEAAGATGALVTGHSANPFSWKALRGSMGSALRLPIRYRLASEDVLEALRSHHVRTVAAIARGGREPDELDWTGRMAVIVGGEGPGLSHAFAARCDVRVTIPMSPAVESLNVTVAAALLLYAARRHRIAGSVEAAQDHAGHKS